MIENIRILMKRPGEKVSVVELANELKALQHFVDGYIEVVRLATDLAVICNEEGRLMGLPYNVSICGHDFVGTILIVGVDGEEFADLPVDVSVIKLLLPQLWEV